MEEVRGNGRTLLHPTGGGGTRARSQKAKEMGRSASHTSFPMFPARNPQGTEQAEAPTEVNWMLMGSLQDRVCCTALNCFIWLLSPACITSSMWKVPGSLESMVMTTDKLGSLAERKMPSTITEQGENCLDRCTVVRANPQDSLTRPLQMRPCASPFFC